MNALINTTGGKPETMTSLEIAEVVNSRHDDVKRSIRRLAEKGVVQLPPMAEVKNHLGQAVQVFVVGERDSYVVVAQLSPEFTARLVDYWQKHKTQQFAVPTTAEAFANAFMMIAEAQRVQAQHEAKIVAINEKVERMEQALTILEKVPPNGELVTYMRKRLKKEFGVSPELTNKILDVFSVHPKFAVRNHHERADGGVNYGYWKREINALVRRFIDECIQVTPAMCEHPLIDGRFRLVKGTPMPPPGSNGASHPGAGRAM